jgi:hypothetical protein
MTRAEASPPGLWPTRLPAGRMSFIPSTTCAVSSRDQRSRSAPSIPRGSWVDSVELVRALVLAAGASGRRCITGCSVEAVTSHDRVTGVRVQSSEVIERRWSS